MATVAVLHHLRQPFLGHAERPLREAGLTIDERFVAAGDPLPRLGEADAVISFGGDQSAVDLGAEPVLAAEAALLREAVDAGVPVLGLCLGGQLLAKALGAEVRRAPRRTVAWHELRRLPGAHGDPIASALPRAVPALHWNEDVFDLPPGAVELLGPRHGGVEAFRAGPSAWGFQFHPEVDPRALDGWYADYAAWVGEAGVPETEARAADERHAAAQAEMGERLFGAFAAIAARAAR